LEERWFTIGRGREEHVRAAVQAHNSPDDVASRALRQHDGGPFAIDTTGIKYGDRPARKTHNELNKDASHATRHSSHATRHTSHVTRHMSHVTHSDIRSHLPYVARTRCQ
jgi:hypothetical protein